MSELARLDEAFRFYEEAQRVSPDGPFEVVFGAAREWRRVLAEGRKPDYEAAQNLLDTVIDNLIPEGHGMAIDAQHIVDAALGGSDSLIVDRSEP